MTRQEKINRMLMLKFEHSYRVAQNCRAIAESIGLSQEDIMRLMCAGYFHDIGYYDLIRHGNYRNPRHAEHGAWIIYSGGIGGVINRGEYGTLHAVRYHNVSKQKFERCRTEYLAILRDADKLDVFRITKQLIDDGRIEEHCREMFDTTPEDYCRDLLSWLDDINYDYTRREIEEMNVISKLEGVANEGLGSSGTPR